MWRTVWLSVLNFFSLGRYSDLIHLNRCDLTFETEPELHMTFIVTGFNNDMYREGSERLVASNPEEPRYCPVNLSMNYVRFLGAGYRGSLLPQCLPGSPNRPNPDKAINYTTALEDFRSLMEQLGYDPKDFGLHSSKRGGATHAAEEGMSADELQRFGHWRSSSMPAKYTDQSTQKRINLSKRLRLL